MSDLKRLDEALAQHYDSIDFDFDFIIENEQTILDAARTYRDLLANGQRVEPDYEAAAKVLDGYLGFDTENFKIARRAVDAAIGDKLLIDPTEEESRDV